MVKRYRHLLTPEERQHLDYAGIRTLAALKARSEFPRCWMCEIIIQKIGLKEEHNDTP